MMPGMDPDASVGDPSVVEGDILSITCPRCGGAATERFYGPCTSCRQQLRAELGGDARQVATEYEPKINVTPNAVALKDD